MLKIGLFSPFVPKKIHLFLFYFTVNIVVRISVLFLASFRAVYIFCLCEPVPVKQCRKKKKKSIIIFI